MSILGIAILAVLIAALGAGGAVLRGWGRRPRPPWTWTLAAPFCAAHRGGAGIYPENTMAAFEAAVTRHGCRFLEIDVHASADGVPVVIHDPTVDRTTDGTGDVRTKTLAELQKLDAGAKFVPLAGPGVTERCAIPTLEAVLRRFSQCWISIDVKQLDPPCEAAVVATIRQAGMAARVIVNSEDRRVERRLRQAGPELASFFTMLPTAVFFLVLWLGLSRWYRPPHHTLQVPERFGAIPIVTKRFIRAAHGLGIPVIVWTVNEAQAMQRLLDLGVDGIITDRPDLFEQVVASAGPLRAP